MARDSPQLIHFFRDNKILSNSADTIYCRRAQGEGGGAVSPCLSHSGMKILWGLEMFDSRSLKNFISDKM